MILILLVLLGRATAHVWRTRDRAEQAFVILAAAIVVPLLAVMLWVPDIANLRLDDMTHYLGRVSRIGWIDPAAEEIRNRVEGVKSVVDELSKPGEPIFDFSNQPALYFFCDRPNPTRFYQVPILSPREYQIETIRALERAKPPLVIRHSPQEFDVFDGIDNSIRAQAVAALHRRSLHLRAVDARRRNLAPPHRRAAAESRRLPAPHPHPDARRARRDRRALARRLPVRRQPARRERRVLAQRSDHPQSAQRAHAARPALRRRRRPHRPRRHDPRRPEPAMGRRRQVALPRARRQRRAVDRISRQDRAGRAAQDVRRRAQRAGLRRRAAVDARLRHAPAPTTPTSPSSASPAARSAASTSASSTSEKSPPPSASPSARAPASRSAKPFEEALGEDASRMISDIDKTLGVADRRNDRGPRDDDRRNRRRLRQHRQRVGDSQFLPAIAR